MHVKHAVSGYLQNGRPQDLSVCHNDNHFGRELTQLLQRINITEIDRLEHREAKFEGRDLYRRRLGCPVTSGRPVRLRNNRSDRVVVTGEGV